MDGQPHRGLISGWRRRLVVGSLGIAFALFVIGGFFTAFFFPDLAPEPLATPTHQPRVGAEASSVPGDTSTGTRPLPTKQPSDPRYAFLLMGYGGGGHDGAYLTDSMIVVIVDPNRKSLTLLSLPRDAWVPLVFGDRTTVYNKLNTAYAFARDSSLYLDRLARYRGNQGAGNFATDTVSRLLGIPISYYLALDFVGFRQAIDAVGGIDVDVPASFSASYPANDDPSIDDSWTVVRFARGPQHMNGERAIEYARARETLDNIAEGSDFARSRRQRLIMEAFKEKLLQPAGLTHLPQLLAIATGHMDTNYTLPSAVQIAQMAADWDKVSIYQAALTNENYLVTATGPQGAYILVPDAPDRSWSRVRALARRLWGDPELGTAMGNNRIAIENDSGVAGLASRVATALSELGYFVGGLTVGAPASYSEVVGRTGGDVATLVRGLEADLHLQLESGRGQGTGGSTGLTLKLGRNASVLSDLAVPVDSTAPHSAVGVAAPGFQMEAAPEPTATATSTGIARVADDDELPAPEAAPLQTELPVATMPAASQVPLITPGMPGSGLSPAATGTAGVATRPPAVTAGATPSGSSSPAGATPPGTSPPAGAASARASSPVNAPPAPATPPAVTPAATP